MMATMLPRAPYSLLTNKTDINNITIREWV